VSDEDDKHLQQELKVQELIRKMLEEKKAEREKRIAKLRDYKLDKTDIGLIHEYLKHWLISYPKDQGWSDIRLVEYYIRRRWRDVPQEMYDELLDHCRMVLEYYASARTLRLKKESTWIDYRVYRVPRSQDAETDSFSVVFQLVNV